MNIKKHPDEATLLSYSAGTLDEAHAVVVSCHLEVCRKCRSAVASAEEVGGVALDSLEAATLDGNAFANMMTRLTEAKVDTAPRSQLHSVWSDLPRALRGYSDVDLSEISWKRVAPGAWQKMLPLGEGAASTLRLLKISPGKKMPEHGHGGQEMTIILQGAYQDEMGYFGPGDVEDLDDHDEHQPIVVSEEDCICLAAAETPAKFKSLAARLVQPIIGI